VRVTNTDSGVEAAAQSNEDGNYNIPFLISGTYAVQAEGTGFKRFVRNGVEIRVSEAVELGIRMELGQVTESVEVNDTTPLLDTAAASLGQVIDTRRITELPISAGSAMELMLLTPGIVEPSKFVWKAAFNNRDTATDGNRAYTTEYQIDGVSNTYADTRNERSLYSFGPPASAVREFKMQTSSYDASVGHTMGSVVNVSTANGTNELHGEAHWFVKNAALDAPNFFNNKFGTKEPVYQDNRFGVSAGGPVMLPRLYNGRNRTFWHYSWEENKWATPSTFTATVPTAGQRQGDFSDLLRLGSGYQIYDPDTITSAAGGRFSRQPLPGNVIPASRLDAIGLKLAGFFPLPNQAGTADGLNNYSIALTEKQRYYVHLARVDHAISEDHRFFVRVHYDRQRADKDRRFGADNPANGLLINRNNKGAALDDVIVLSPSLVLNLRYGVTYQTFGEQRISSGFDLSSLGFSTALTSLVDRNVATIPYVTAGPYAAVNRWQDGDGATTSLTHSVGGHFTKLLGSHNLKFGTEFRAHRAFNNRFPRSTAPAFEYNNVYTRGPLDNSPAARIGQELAAMLLGIPAGNMEHSASFALQDTWWGTYLHDDLKVSPKLTLNLGLRYELESPMTERFNRLVAGFDATAASPLDAAARANYARAPIPEIAPGDFRALGGLTFTNQGGIGRAPYRGERNNFMPRIGLAYQLRNSTVFRAGYGLYYGTLGVNSTSPIQTGFTQSTPIQASLDNGLSFRATNANPFPDGLIAPLGAAGGLTTNLGQSISFYLPDRKHAYSQRWSAGFQQLLPLEFLVDISYVANRGTRIEVDRPLNVTPREYLSRSPMRDQATIDYLSATFTSPFAGTNPIYGARMSRAALLQPYPHFGNISVGEPIGYSWYHSMQLRAEKRFSRGYTFQLAYTWSKLMEAVEFLNPTDPLPYETIGSFDRPHRLAMSGIWEIPVGRGRAFLADLPAPVEFIAGGWQLGAVIVRQAGGPLAFGNALFVGDIKDIVLPKSERSADRWFNTEAGFNRTPAQQLASNIRAFPLRLSGVRGDGRATWDFSAIKNFRIRERAMMQFRAEAYNAWNHPNFNNPNQNPTATAFGSITAAGPSRNFQLALKLKF
jgi:hypothetical protein